MERICSYAIELCFVVLAGKGDNICFASIEGIYEDVCGRNYS